jgi:transcriptional regulator GlxA family with amidase domain
VLFPEFQLLDAAGPIAAFEIASRFKPSAYTLKLSAAEAGLVASSSGAPMAGGEAWPRTRRHDHRRWRTRHSARDA